MFDLFASGLAVAWLQKAEVRVEAASGWLTWQGMPYIGTVVPAEPEIGKGIDRYLTTLKDLGSPAESQRIWVENSGNLIIDRNGRQPVPVASLTKAATSLAALQKWGIDHRFITQIGIDGKIVNGRLQGNLIVNGGGDPLFVWEDAIALAQTLNQMGIKEVSGDLIVTGNFYMNYQANPAKAGALLRQGLTGKNLPQELLNTELKDVNIIKVPIARSLKIGLPKVVISGTVRQELFAANKVIPAIEHRSLPLVEIVREMNIYSNNEIAQMLADSVGGHQSVASIVGQITGVPSNEILLANGSGLGMENQMSPHAVVKIMQSLHKFVEPAGLTIGDLFPVAGRDRSGTMENRQIPAGTAIKTGTLREVSALAGVVPTQKRGLIWFAIVNKGGQIDRLRQEQDRLLKSWLTEWQSTPTNPRIVDRLRSTPAYLGDPGRNKILPLPSPSPQ
jgi:serine-type D-Ala-D-Ala carboxypeptidase/endopeptidase (penicillin-binding protein 4)